MRGGVVARAAVIGVVMYIAMAILMHDTVMAYFSTSENLKDVASAINLDLNNGNPNSANPGVIGIPEPQIQGGIMPELTFLAPLLSIWDTIKTMGMVALTPALLMFLPDYIVPAPVKWFMLLPINVLVIIGILGAIRGYNI